MNKNDWNKMVDLKKQIDKMTPSQIKDMRKFTENIQNRMLNPKLRKQIESLYKWQREFIPKYKNHDDIRHVIENIDDIPKPFILNKQINQFRRISQSQPLLHRKIIKLFNQLSHLDTSQLKHFYNTNVSSSNVYKNYASKQSNNNSTKDLNKNIIINNGGTININENTNNSSQSSYKLTLIISIITMILTIIFFFAANNPNQVEANINGWIKATRNIK